MHCQYFTVRDLSPEHGGSKSLRSHTLHDPIGIKANDKRIRRQVTVDEGVDLQPLVVVLGPPVAQHGFTIVTSELEAVGKIRDAILVVAEVRGEEAERIEFGQKVAVQEVHSVADQVCHKHTWPAVHGQCDR